MPRIPFLYSHAECIDILVEEFQQTDGLNDGLVLPVDVQLDFVSWEQMGKTQSWLF